MSKRHLAEENSMVNDIILEVKFPLKHISKDLLCQTSQDKGYSKEEVSNYLRLLDNCCHGGFYRDFHEKTIPTEFLNKLDTHQAAAPLHYAAMNGNVEMVKFLLQSGADVDICAGFKVITPLICATAFGHLEITKLLLDHGSDVDIGLHQGQNTALLWAVRRKYVDIVQCLLDNDAGQSSSVLYTETPIHAAVIAGSVEILEMLISVNNDAKKVESLIGSNRGTPLHLAASNFYPNPKKICTLLLQKGYAQPNIQNAKGQTALHIAAKSHKPGLIKLFLKFGANLEAMDNEGKLPIFYVISDTPEAIECLELLLDFDSSNRSVNHQDSLGHSPLHIAAMNEAEVAAQILLLRGADFSIKYKQTSFL